MVDIVERLRQIANSDLRRGGLPAHLLDTAEEAADRMTTLRVEGERLRLDNEGLRAEVERLTALLKAADEDAGIEATHAGELEARLTAARAEGGRYRRALETIRKDHGRVCSQYEICTHVACRSSHASWELANSALATVGGEPDKQDNGET